LIGQGYGVSDGFRIPSDPLANQQDQALDEAEEWKLRQDLRKSATSRNREIQGLGDPGKQGRQEVNRWRAP
jgi:hypothetical protein